MAKPGGFLLVLLLQLLALQSPLLIITLDLAGTEMEGPGVSPFIHPGVVTGFSYVLHQQDLPGVPLGPVFKDLPSASESTWGGPYPSRPSLLVAK